MNILWICTDQQRMDTLGCYGNRWVHTPNLDRLAESGVKFDRAYSQCPVCAPSRASFLTGRYPRTCRVRQNGQDMPEEEILVPRMLKDNGYFCGLSGKLHISACGQEVTRIIEPRINDGYDFFSWSHHPQRLDKSNWTMNGYAAWLNQNGQDYITPNREDCRFVQTGVEEKWHQTTWCTNQAIEFMESAKRTELPWLFSINYYDPHHPFDPPEEYLNRYLDIVDDLPLPDYIEGELATKPLFGKKDHAGAYDTPGNYAYDDMTEHDHKMVKAAYYAMIDLIDHQVGRLMDWLEENGQLEDTMIIFTSDHGECLGDHGIYLKGPYFFESNIHVPLIISCKGKIQGGRESNALVELTDLAPTICAAAGIKPHAGMQGQSLWPLLTGTAPLDEHRDSVYSEYYNSNINHTDPQAFVTTVFDGRYKLAKVHDIYHQQTITGELYDLKNDPGEHDNLYLDDNATAIKVNMLELLSDRMAQTADPLPIRKSWW